MLDEIQNLWLAVPALTALTIQAWLITHSDKRKLIQRNWPILLFFMGTVGLTSIEFTTYIGIIETNIVSMKLFYIFCCLTFSGLLILAMQLSGIKSFNSHLKLATTISLCLIFLFSSITLSTNLIIAGIESIGYSITRIPGDLYFIAQVYGAGLILLTIYLLIAGAHSKFDGYDKKRARVLLLSTSPLLLIFLSLIIVMSIGLKINASLIVPFALTYMLIVIINTEQKHSLFALLVKIPYTTEHKTLKQITAKIENFLANTDNGNQSSLKDLTTSIEQQIVSLAVQMTNGSQAKAATLLNVSASSICRKKKLVSG